MPKASDRHVGDGDERVKDQPIAAVELGLVVRLQLILCGWQEGARRVVDKIQAESTVPVTVSEIVEPSEALNAASEDTTTSLTVDIGLEVAREARHNVDSLSCKEVGQIFLAGFRQDGEVAAVDDPQPFEALACWPEADGMVLEPDDLVQLSASTSAADPETVVGLQVDTVVTSPPFEAPWGSTVSVRSTVSDGGDLVLLAGSED